MFARPLVATFVTFCCASSVFAVAPAKPNVVYFIIDDK